MLVFVALVQSLVFVDSCTHPTPGTRTCTCLDRGYNHVGQHLTLC
jgi:hypothetical protein